VNTRRTIRKQEILNMRRQMIEWLVRQQITNSRSPHYGCIYYADEDRYCNRDTGCAASIFMYESHLTGKQFWKGRALIAKEHVLKSQGKNGGYPEMRHRKKSDNGSTVNTAIIADSLVSACELGIPYDEKDLTALERMAEFQMTLEWKPGAFYHDTNHIHSYQYRERGKVKWGWGPEGSHLDCQNTTALAAMMLIRISDFLEKHQHSINPEWEQASVRAVKHLLSGQDRNGHWPYFKNGKGFDVGHHSLCMFCLAKIIEHPRFSDNKKILHTLVRAGLWTVNEGLLQTKRGTKINWAINHSACSYFTAEYFLVAASLMRVAALKTRESRIFQREALELLRYVRTDLWENSEAEKQGPFRLTEGYLCAGYAWFGQSMAWVLYFFNDLLGKIGWLKDYRNN